MGLDQYAYVRTELPSENPVDFFPDEEEEEVTGEWDRGEMFHSWRKHPDLHGWMEALYFKRGGVDRDFNMSPVALMAEDLDELERTVLTGGLPNTQGFFFGNSRPENKTDDLDFIAKAREAITGRKFVYYYAWW